MRKAVLILVSLIIHGYVLYVAWPEGDPQATTTESVTESPKEEAKEIERKESEAQTTQPLSNGSQFLDTKMGKPIIIYEGKITKEVHVSGGLSPELFLGLVLALSFAFHAAVVVFKIQ